MNGLYKSKRIHNILFQGLFLLLIAVFVPFSCAKAEDYGESDIPDVETKIITQDGKHYLNVDDSLCIYMESAKDSAEYIRDRMRDHDKAIRLAYGFSSGSKKEDSVWEEISRLIYDQADVDKEYFRLSVEENEVRMVDTGTIIRKADGTARIFYYEYKPTYYTTADQEKKLRQEVKKKISSLSLSGSGDYEKAEKIHAFICKNVDYDWDFNPVSFSAYGALIKGKATCQGYATLFYLMGREAGLDVSIVCGEGDDDGDWIDHAWNVVKIDGKNYYLDATWDDLDEEMDVSYDYFLKGSSAFKEDHKAVSAFAVSNSDYPVPVKKVPVRKVVLSGISHKIAAGRRIPLKASVYPLSASNKRLVWKSSNPKVAKVNQNGVVTIKKKTGGKSVTITATSKDGSKRKASWTIKVMKGKVKKIAIKAKKKVKAGKSLKLKAKVKATKGANKTLKWFTSNSRYATVNAKGKVKTRKAGKGRKVKITAMATDGTGRKKSVTIKIK